MWRHVTRMCGHVVTRNVRIHGMTRLWPITRVTSEYTRRWRHWSVRVHEVEFWIVMIGGNKKVLLIFIGSWISRRRLHRLSQTSKVKFVSISLAVHFRHDVFIVVVSKRSAELVVVHVWLGLPLAPSPSNLIRVHQFELAVRSLPRDVVCVTGVGQELQ